MMGNREDESSVAELLERHFEVAFSAPEGVNKLRELILTLAMKGKLVPQDPNDQPASELLKEIEKESVSREGAKTRRKDSKLPPISANEVPYALPSGWKWVRLGQIAEINGGFAFKSSNYSVDGIRVIRISDFDEKGFKNDKIVRYPYSDDLEGFCVDLYNILMAMTGGTVGKSMLVNSLPELLVVNQRVATIKIYLPIVPEFIDSLLRSNQIQSVIKEAKQSTNDNISMGDITGFFVPLPPLAEQHRIVVRIDELMARCDALEKLRAAREEKRIAVHAAAIKQLVDTKNFAASAQAWRFISRNFGELYAVRENVAELRKAILQLAVMGKLVPQDPNDPPASELLKEIEAEKQRLVKAGKIKKQKPLPPINLDEVSYDLPKGWEWVRLGDVISLLGDGIHGTPTYNESGEYFFINGNNLFDGVIVIKKSTKRVSLAEYEKHKKELTERTVFVSINGTLGNVAFYNDEPVILGKSVCYFNLFSQIEKDYIKKLLNSSYFTKYAFQSATGSTIKNVSLKAMREFCVPFPSQQEQQRIVAKIDQLMTLCDTLESQINAKAARQAELLGAVMA